MRIGLAFRCFFKLLFGGTLPDDARELLPEQPKELPPPEAAPKEKEVAKAEPAKPRKNVAEYHREGALVLLGLLQREGRLVDFLNESIDDYDDTDVGAAVRDIHRGCKKVLDSHVSLEPVMPGEEEDKVKVPTGFDPGEIRLVGNVDGEPPFQGVLRHHGWRATETKLPTLSEGVDRRVVAPAEVELG